MLQEDPSAPAAGGDTLCSTLDGNLPRIVPHLPSLPAPQGKPTQRSGLKEPWRTLSTSGSKEPPIPTLTGSAALKRLFVKAPLAALVLVWSSANRQKQNT